MKFDRVFILVPSLIQKPSNCQPTQQMNGQPIMPCVAAEVDRMMLKVRGLMSGDMYTEMKIEEIINIVVLGHRV